MPISQISLANTFSEWVSSTIGLISSANQLETGDYTKTSNTLFISSSGVGLSVSNNAIVGGSLTLYGNGTTLLVSGDSNFSGNTTYSKKIISTVANGAFLEINSANLISNLNSQFVGGFSKDQLLLGYSTANLALSTAQSAFGQANTGIDYAKSAFAQANAAILAADANATILFVSNAYNQANVATVYATSAFSAANNAGIYALPAFTQANTALATGQAAFTQANTALTTGQAAFTQANTAQFTAESGLNVAQSAFSAANNAGIYALPAFTQANTALTTGQAAFTQANSATVVNSTQNNNIVSAFTQANTALTTGQAAFAQANLSYNTAQSAYNNSNTKFSSSGGIITGNVTMSQSLTVEGNLNVSGNVNSVQVNSIAVTDNMIYLNADANTALADIGFAGAYNNGTYQHTGFFRDSDDGIWKVFDNYLPEPDASVFINTGHASYRAANLQADMFVANSLKLNGSSSGSVRFKAATSGSTLNYTLPSADGSSGQALVTNGSGTLSWTSFLTSLTGSAGQSLSLSGSSSGTVQIRTAASTSSTTYILPSADGSSGQALVTNGSGTLSWTSFLTSLTGSAGQSLSLSGSSSGTVQIRTAASTSSTTYILPSADGSSGQALVTNGSGTLSWAAAGQTINITDTTTNSTFYPTFLSSTSGALSGVNTSSSKLSFNPSTGTLNSTIVNASSGINLGGSALIGSNREYIGFREKMTSIGTVSTSTTLDLSTGHVFTITLGGNVTFTFTNAPPSGVVAYVTIILTQDGSGNRTASFTGAKYTDGTPPVLSTTAGAIDVLTFMTYNGGTSWLGSYVMAAVA